MSNKKVTIKIPSELYKNLKKLIENTGFSSVTEFITFVLRSVAAGKTLEKEGLSKEKIEEVREKLKSLGYIK
jgi:Arc/MetJ-type ribon-helix-helix transcriptional regulator